MFSNFSILDIVIMTVYLSGLVILGIYLKKKAAGSIKEYFLGGNKIPWWAMGISGMASQLDMTGTMVIVSLLYMFGSRGMYIEIRGGLVLIMAFAMVFMGKWNYRSKCMTVAEWMEYRFGKGFPGESARILQAFAVIVMTVGMLAMFVKGSGLFLSLFLPFSPMVCAIIMFSIATIYTAISGFYGVVFTDIFQAIFILVASIAVSFLAYNKVVDNATFSQIAEQVTRNKDWMSTAIPAHIDMPEAYSIFEKFALAISFYVLLTVFTGMSKSGGRPMYFGARDERECGTLSFVWILASAIRWPMIIGFVILGIFFVKDYFSDPAVVQQAVELVKSHIPDIPEHSWNEKIESIISVPGQYPVQLIEGLKDILGSDWASKLKLLSYYGTVNAEQILPSVILYSFPQGLRAIIFVALIAAAMSTFDTYVNMAGGYFVRDIYQRHIRPKAENKELIWASYSICVLLVVLGGVLGFYAKSVNKIWEWLMVGVGGGIALPSLLRWYWWRFNGVGFACGIFAGIIAAIAQRYYTPGLPPWERLPVVLGVSLVGSLAGTYLTKPTNTATLRHFYRTTRPFGFWKPFKKELGDELRSEYSREHRNDIISLLFAIPWQFLLYWTPVQFMLHSFRRFYISLALLIICSIGLYFFWYKNLTKATYSKKSELK